MQRFTRLKVWQRSHQLAPNIYRVTAALPAQERFGLLSQIRRAAVSVPANIAEGSKRQSNREYARFLNIAEGSVAELEYLIILSRDLGYLTPGDLESLSSEIADIARMLHALRTKVESPA